MKIFVPFPYYYPEQCAGLNIIDDILRECARQGIEAQLYVPTPTRNVPAGAAWQRDEAHEGGRFKIHRFLMYSEGKNPWARALRYMLNECAYLYAMLRYDYDAIFLVSTPPIQGLKLPLLRLLKRRPVIYDVQDVFPESLVGAGLAKRGGVLWRIGNWISNIAYRNADKIVVISDGIKQTLINKGVPAEKIEVIYNWVDETRIVPVARKDNPLFDELGLDREKFRVVYAGNLGFAQNIDVIISAAERLKSHPEIEFAIFGSGGREDEIKAAINARGLVNVKMFPLQAPEHASLVYGLGHVCVVSCNEGFGGVAMPSKTWSILSAGRPVLANFDHGELEHILESNNCGVFTEAGNACAMAEAILALSHATEQCDEMGRNGRRFIETRLRRAPNLARYISLITAK